MPIRIFEHDELFHQAGPEESLDYLWDRLQDRDLSGEEALALLSAVHRQLGTQRTGDPKVYLAYARFMESLSREMPLVHDYVVARWIENRRSSRRQSRQTGDPAPDNAGEDELAAAQPDAAATVPTRAADPFPLLVSIGGGSGDEPAEPGEPDEADDPVDDRPPRAGDGEAEPAEDDEGESADEDRSESSAHDEADEELTGQEEGSEAEAAEADPEGDDSPQEAEPEPAEGDSQPEEEADEGDPGEAADGRAVDKAEVEEGEWPAEEAPEPAEPTEEMEGEGDEPSPED